MKIDKLKEGQVFKNYRELCKELEMPVKAGNTKKAQMNELDRYCLLKKEGNKLIVHELFDIPHPKTETRGAKSIYGDILTLLITDTLIERWNQTENSTILMTRNNILKDTNMINDNYSYCSVNVLPLSSLLKVNVDTVNDFFNSTTSSFKHAIESSLGELRNRSLIMFDKTTMICSEKGIHTKATHEEKDFILKCEREILEALGYNSIQQIRNSRNWKNFKAKIKKMLGDSMYRIKFYYSSYEITLNTSFIEDNHNKDLIALIDNIDNLDRKEKESNLNSIICKRLLENAKKRSENTSADSKLLAIRSSDKYITENSKLIEALIDTDAKSIKEDIKNTRKLNF